MIHLLVSEHQTYSNNHNNIVRIFLDRNYDYGLWINEKIVFEKLDKEQQLAYTTKKCEFDIPLDVARYLLKEGKTPFTKQRILKEVN